MSGRSTATDALRTFFPRASEPMRIWAANRVILLDDVVEEADAAFAKRAVEFAASTRALILASHALDKTIVKALSAGKADAFLRGRHERLESVLQTFIERMTESQFEDTPPLDDLSLDEGEGRDDDAQE
jgi:hypothetical protein